MIIKRSLVFYGLFVGALTSCNEDPEINKKVWMLDMGEHFSTSYPLSGTMFKTVLLNSQYILINEFSPAGSHLVEVDFKNGKFGRSFLKDYNIWDMKRRGDDILVASVSSTHYKMGIYNSETLGVDFFSEAERINLNDPPGSNAWTNSNSYIYTHNPNINPIDESEVYIAKWNFHGELAWRKEVSPMNDFKVANIPITHDDYVVFLSVSNHDRPEEKWGIGKLSADGELVWHRDFEKENSLWQLTEDFSGNIFAINGNFIFKLNTIGAIVWINPLASYVDGLVSSQSICTADGGLVFIAQATDGTHYYTLVKINSAGKKVWQIRDVNGIGVSLLELPEGDILTTTLDGQIVRYSSK